jgi:hypothetical protein
VHPGVRRLKLQTGQREYRQPAGPGITKPRHPRPLARPLGLVAIEEAGLQHERACSDANDRHRPLQDLREVVVYRIAEDRTGHRIVGSERREALSYRGGNQGLSQRLSRRQHDLVHVGVRMAPVDETFTPVAWGELTLRNGETLEIDRGEEP